MKFVKKRPSVRMLKAVALGEEPATWRAVLRHFRELCNRLGGSIHEDSDFVSCIKMTEAIGELADDVHEFHSFITEWRPAIVKPLELTYINRLIGGWEEVANVSYDPKNDMYDLYVHLYGEGTSPEGVTTKGTVVKGRELSKKVSGVVMKIEGVVEQNSATDEFAGSADVWASIPLREIRSKVAAPELKNLLEEMMEEAEEAAEWAEEINIVEVEEEEW